MGKIFLAEKGKAFLEKAMALLVRFMQEFKSEPLPLRSDSLTKKEIG